MARRSSRQTKRASRMIHLVLAAFLGVFLYSPLAESTEYALFVQVVIFPAFVLTGLVMWKGRTVRRLLGGRRSAGEPNGRG